MEFWRLLDTWDFVAVFSACLLTDCRGSGGNGCAMVRIKASRKYFTTAQSYYRVVGCFEFWL